LDAEVGETPPEAAEAGTEAPTELAATAEATETSEGIEEATT
jgi:hypothetical protein